MRDEAEVGAGGTQLVVHVEGGGGCHYPKRNGARGERWPLPRA